MQITITPEAEAELTRQAAVAGRNPEAQAASLLEQVLAVPTTVKSGFTGKELIEICAMVRGLTEDVDFSRARSTWRPLDLE